MPISEIADAGVLQIELGSQVKIETPTTEPSRVNALMDVDALNTTGLAHQTVVLCKFPPGSMPSRSRFLVWSSFW